MSIDEKVSRNEEIRALFIFGLLAVFAAIRVQYSTLTLTYPYGTINLVPVIDIIIILWSLYAFFMVLGLSEDTIGKSAADTFRGVSMIFLRYSYLTLGTFLVPFGLIVYGLRIIFVLFIILAAVIVFLYVQFSKRPKRLHKRLSLKDLKKSLKAKVKKEFSSILGLAFLFSATVVLAYPESWFASPAIFFIAFVIAVITVSLMVAFQKSKTNNKIDDYST